MKQGVKELFEKALTDAKDQLHPLLRQVDLYRLTQRSNFLQRFRIALERRTAQQIILWLPFVKAVYRFDPFRETSTEDWDGSIHLLVLVPQIMISIRSLEAKLDYETLRQLQSLNWTRFQHSKSVVEIRQVTLYEIHHGICSGAMFYSAYAVPSQVCPSG